VWGNNVAFLYISEFAEMEIGWGGRQGQIAQQPPLVEQAIANGGGNTQSNAFNAKTRFVRLHADSICAIAFGTNPTAVAAGASGTARLAANQTEYFGVPVGQSFKVAAILST
jgi:hypothetical protein